MDVWGLILKVLVLSLGISVAIKYLMPALAIAPTTTNVLIAVCLPTIVLGLLLIQKQGNRTV
jgi:hypothetical protein